jgi:LCP family protein required for cell wall assembly
VAASQSIGCASGPDRRPRLSFRAMSTPQRAPRSRSAFAAAFLSLLFPGLGHAYAGAWARALAFAALPLLLIALVGGIALRADRAELLGTLIDPGVLTALFIGNVLALVYRVVAAVDAWQVARFLNAQDAAGEGRAGRTRLPLNPVSAAGLLAVLLVIGAGHLAVARYNVLALDLVNCVFTDEGASACDEPADNPSPRATAEPGDSPEPTDAAPSATDSLPTPDPGASGALAPTLPPWDGKERLNVLLVGADTRPGDVTFNTDTLIVVSVDPVSKQVAMFQVPRDMVDVPVPANARSLWGSVYGGKVNSWLTQNRNRVDLWPGKTTTTRGFNALKALLGELYGLDIRYYVKVDFQGFRKVVDTLGGVQINVQMPVYESQYPAGGALRRVYIASGPQHMTGGQALIYARSRHRAAGGDFDRGRRQQRVLLSLREQMNAQAIIANLPSLVDALKTSIKTDIPTSELPKLLGLAESVDTRDIRSYVFAPRFYATEYLSSPRGYIITPNVARIRNAVRNAFTVSPDLLETRDRLGSEGAAVWIYNGSGRTGLATRAADYLTYYGLEASAPNRKVAAEATTEITVYNGAEKEMPETITYLEQLYGTTVKTASDPSVTVDIIVTLGQNAPDRSVDAVG